MAKRSLLKLPDDLEGNLRALLLTPPPAHDIRGSRKAAPKPKPRLKPKHPRKGPTARAGTSAYESTRVLKEKPKRKAANKR